MISYDKSEVKEALSLDNIYEILDEFGGNPQYAPFGIISETICHNPPGEGSKKLYFYENSNLFHCYTGCDNPSFDIFELVTKIMKIQFNQDYDLNDSVRFVAIRFGIAGSFVVDEGEKLEDWELFDKYSEIRGIKIPDTKKMILKEYDNHILDKFNYKLKIEPWLAEGISQEAMDKAQIGFFPGNNQITIPHFDLDGRLIGVRGRTLSKEDAELYGKYRPLFVNQQWYNHPLGANLYGINWAKDNIKNLKKAIIFESEKSVLLYQSYFGVDSSIAVACCGSNISNYQFQELLDSGAEEIIIALDRQFKEINDSEFKHLKKNLLKMYNKYKNYVNVSIIFDKNMITNYKSSPIDEGKEKFLKLFQERIIP